MTKSPRFGAEAGHNDILVVRAPRWCTRLPRRRATSWLMVAAALVLTPVLYQHRGQTRLTPGASIDTEITLVPADREQLDCMAPSALMGYECGFKDAETPSDVDERHRLRPYLTVYRQLWLIPGLFLQPAMAAHGQPAAGNAAGRFVVRCQLKFLGKLGQVRLRWSHGGAWEPPEVHSVAEPVSCRIKH